MGPQCFWSIFIFFFFTSNYIGEGNGGSILMDDKWLCTAIEDFPIYLSFEVRVCVYFNFCKLSWWWCLKLRYQSELFTVMHSVMFVIVCILWFHDFLPVFWDNHLWIKSVSVLRFWTKTIQNASVVMLEGKCSNNKSGYFYYILHTQAFVKSLFWINTNKKMATIGLSEITVRSRDRGSKKIIWWKRNGKYIIHLTTMINIS